MRDRRNEVVLPRLVQEASKLPVAENDYLLPHVVRVEGVDVRFDIRGEGEQTLVLVHGHHAHHLWWHGVENHLRDRFRTVVLDLSGHGDSGHRNEYDGVCWAEDVVAVLRQLDDRVILVGHSMGGRIALVAAARRPESVAGVILLDSVVRPDGIEKTFEWHADRTPLVRPTRAEALSRFCLRPFQERPGEAELAPVAAYAIREHDGGWTWKYDQRGLPTVPERAVQEALTSMTVPVLYVRAGESGVVTEEMYDYVGGLRSPGGIETMSLPGMHHHVVLEDPKLCAELITGFSTSLGAPQVEAETA